MINERAPKVHGYLYWGSKSILHATNTSASTAIDSLMQSIQSMEREAENFILRLTNIKKSFVRAFQLNLTTVFIIDHVNHQIFERTLRFLLGGTKHPHSAGIHALLHRAFIAIQHPLPVYLAPILILFAPVLW